MSKISEIQKIREFTSDNSGATYGVYSLIHNGKQQVFIRNGDSIGAVSHFFGEPASKCVNEIRDDVKQAFLAQLALQCIYKECGGCENWSGSDCTLVAPDTGCPFSGPQEAGEESE